MKTKCRLWTAAALAATMLVLVVAAKQWPEQFFSVYPAISRFLLKGIAAVTSLLPFALWELAVVLLVVWLVFTMIRAIRRKKLLRWAAGVILVLCMGIFSFVSLWGLNYFAPSMASRLGLEETQYTPEQLKTVTIYFRNRAIQSARQVPRDEDGLMVVDFDACAAQAGEGYALLSETMKEFTPTSSTVKPLLSDKYMISTGTTGIFICLTGESCVCGSTFVNQIPFTMCHELGHAMAFARENEANFAAYLACAASSSPVFRYSGEYQCFLYCYNALYKVDPDAAREVMAGASSLLLADINAAARHHDAVTNKTAVQASNKVYNTYLKAFSVNNGTQSYGEVVDLLAMWYYQRIVS